MRQPGVVASNQQTPNDIAIDNTNVYWVDAFGGTVDVLRAHWLQQQPDHAGHGAEWLRLPSR